MPLPFLDLHYLQETLTRLLLTPSPVGDTEAGAALCVEFLCALGDLHVEITRKGVVVARWKGENDGAPRAVTAHIDTLGALVKGIKETGRLSLSQLGNYSWNSVENETVTVAAQRINSPQRRAKPAFAGCSVREGGLCSSLRRIYSLTICEKLHNLSVSGKITRQEVKK